MLDEAALKDFLQGKGLWYRLDFTTGDHWSPKSRPAVVGSASSLLDPDIGIGAHHALDHIYTRIIDIVIVYRFVFLGKLLHARKVFRFTRKRVAVLIVLWEG